MNNFTRSNELKDLFSGRKKPKIIMAKLEGQNPKLTKKTPHIIWLVSMSHLFISCLKLLDLHINSIFSVHKCKYRNIFVILPFLVLWLRWAYLFMYTFGQSMLLIYTYSNVKLWPNYSTSFKTALSTHIYQKWCKLHIKEIAEWIYWFL